MISGGEGLELSGERFVVVYSLAGPESPALEIAKDICIEQTVEFPEDLISAETIRRQIFGRIESFRPAGEGDQFEAVISYAVEVSGFELTQLLNVVFGNISIKPGIRVEKIELSGRLLSLFKGPRFGRKGLRELVGVERRALLCTALKPMGLSTQELAELAYKFALGGIDIIKDDHGLANQSFSPFRERVERCASEIERANRSTAGRCMYVPNITADCENLDERVLFAREAGAGGLLISPGLTGYDAMRRIAGDDAVALPVVNHPAFQGGFVVHPRSGLSHRVLFGQLARLAGADASIFPSCGGRFSFSREECREIAESTHEPMGGLKSIFPCPGGGMNMENIPDMLELYGDDAIFLIGGGLFRRGGDLVENCRHLLALVSGHTA